MKIKLTKNFQNHIPVKHGGIFSISNPNPSIIDFSANVSPLGCPPLVKREIKKGLKNLAVYPDSNSEKLRKNLSWYTKLTSDNLTVGNGATEIIYNFCNAFLSKSKKVLIPIPTFGEYEAASCLVGCRISFFKTMNLEKSLNSFINKIPKNGCIFLCNPNNPTGKLMPKKKLLKIIQAAHKKNSFVFVDECFIELVPISDESVIKYVTKYDNLFVLRSLTKSFGLAGIRVGYGASNKKIISILNKIKIPWNVSGLAQNAASAALCHHFYIEKTKKLIKKESKYLINQIAQFEKFTCHHSDTNFLLIKSTIKSKILQKKLLAKKILVRDCSDFKGLNDNYIRIAIKTHKENVVLIKALAKI